MRSMENIGKVIKMRTRKTNRESVHDDDVIEVCCENCHKCFYIYMGMSMVQCPNCGKVSF